jgi:toxin HigB-1
MWQGPSSLRYTVVTSRSWTELNQFRGLDFEAAIDLLLALNVAATLQELGPLKSVGLHKLKGERKGPWAMTVNRRWRICFKFRRGDAYDVEVVDYHRG